MDTASSAYAINERGEKVTDTEYGFGSKVVSIFHPGYRNTAHTFIKSLAKGIDTKKILYFETTVEPQYMGTIALCYSDAAKREYEKWRETNNINDEESKMPFSFPIPLLLYRIQRGISFGHNSLPNGLMKTLPLIVK